MITSKTPLYKAVKKALGKDDDWKEISKNLCQVRDNILYAQFLELRLSEAFVWEFTSQGDAYWRAIHKRMGGRW